MGQLNPTEPFDTKPQLHSGKDHLKVQKTAIQWDNRSKKHEYAINARAS